MPVSHKKHSVWKVSTPVYAFIRQDAESSVSVKAE